MPNLDTTLLPAFEGKMKDASVKERGRKIDCKVSQTEKSFCLGSNIVFAEKFALCHFYRICQRKSI